MLYQGLCSNGFSLKMFRSKNERSLQIILTKTLFREDIFFTQPKMHISYIGNLRHTNASKDSTQMQGPMLPIGVSIGKAHIVNGIRKQIYT